MTPTEQIAAWHRNPPEWARHLKGRDWDVAELIALQFEISAAEQCRKAGTGRRGQRAGSPAR